MSDEHTPGTPESDKTPMPMSASRSDQRGGPKSVELRSQQEAGQNIADLMDPAQKSLADALRIMYRLLQVAMVLLVVLFVFSGFKRVNENERGVKTVFGKPVDTSVSAGGKFNWPYPIGDIRTVDTSRVGPEFVLADPVRDGQTPQDAFMPMLTKNERDQLVNKGYNAISGGPAQLDPVEDGSVLMADGSIAHLQVEVTYRRQDVDEYLARVQDIEQEKRLVHGVVKQAVVFAGAQSDLLEVMPTPGLIEPIVRERANKLMEQLGCGIEVEEIKVRNVIPPRRIIDDFNKVTRASDDARQAVTQKESQANEIAASTAGRAWDQLIKLIDRYELELEADDDEAAQRTLDALMASMRGQETELDGETIVAVNSGQVSTVISEARQYVDRIVSEAQARAARFNAKLEAYNANPRLMLQQEHLDAIGTFYNQPNLQVVWLSPTADEWVLQLHSDKELAKQIEQQINETRAQEAEKQRRREQERQRREKQIETLNETEG